VDDVLADQLGEGYGPVGARLRDVGKPVGRPGETLADQLGGLGVDRSAFHGCAQQQGQVGRCL
jgi:hypothetical protein